MKQILSYLLLITLSLQMILSPAMVCQAEESKTTREIDTLYARSAVLMDADSGRILFEKEGKTPLPMASTTKIMTCILTLENGNLEDLVTVSKYASTMPDVQLNIREGEQYLLRDLLYSLMLESHNDSAVAIAEHIGGSVEGFADMMNQKAKEIGCKATCFITPNGLDAKKEVTAEDGSTNTIIHSTTAEDLALIMSYCIKKSPMKDTFLEITRAASHSFSNIEGTRNFSCNNHNAFLNMMEGALSGKTGFTGNAGYCYVGALERDGKTFVVALLACGWPNNKTYKWSDTKKLMEYGLANYQKVDFSTQPIKEEWLKNIPVHDAKTKKIFQMAEVEVYIKDEKVSPTILMKQEENVKIECSITKQLTAPVEKNQQVGMIRYLVDGEVIWERPICTKFSVEKKDFVWYMKQVLDNYFVLFNG